MKNMQHFLPLFNGRMAETYASYRKSGLRNTGQMTRGRWRHI